MLYLIPFLFASYSSVVLLQESMVPGSILEFIRLGEHDLARRPTETP